MILFAHALHHICIFTMFHAFGCVFYMLKSCVLIGLDWAKPMMFLLLHVTCSCIFHAYIPFFSFFLILLLIGTFLLLFLSLSLSWLVCSWHLKRASLLYPETLFILGHHLLPLLILTPLMLGSMMIKPVRTFRKTFLDMAFLRNTKSSFWIFSILTFLLSSTVGVGSPFVTSRSLVPS